MIRIVKEISGKTLYLTCWLGFLEICRDHDGDIIATLKLRGRPAKSWLLYEAHR